MSSSRDHDGVSLLDPAYAAVMGELPAFHLSDDTVGPMRAQIGLAAPPFTPSGAVTHTDVTVPAPDGHDVVLRIYTPAGATGPRPCVYAIHGGGYVMGTYDMLDRIFDGWCSRLGIVGVSVEYRLAPEAAYPDPARGLLRRPRLGARARTRSSGSTPTASGSRAPARAAGSPPRSHSSPATAARSRSRSRSSSAR